MSKMALVFSMKERRPGCVLLQGAMGGTVPGELFQRLFPVETWLLAPTDDMTPYMVDEDLLKRISAQVRREQDHQ